MAVKPLNLNAVSCTQLRGVGDRVAEKLLKLGLRTIQDILFHLPFRYQDRTHVSPLNQVRVGDHAVIEGEIQSVQGPHGGRTKLLCVVHDGKGFITLRFFHVNRFQRQALQVGERVHCFGEARLGARGLEMIHPEYQVIQPNTIITQDKTLTPIYPATEGVSQLMLRKLTDQALLWLDRHDVLELIPVEVLQLHGFTSLKQALQFVHRPPIGVLVETLEEKAHIHQKRLMFEELLAHRLSLLKLKKNFQTQLAVSLASKNQLTERLKVSLPFQLTAAQQRVIAEVQQDLMNPYPMLRLVQGDVGSGKTVVALMAMLQAVENQYQAAMLAPTEILAEQHFEQCQKRLSPLGVTVVFLSGQLKALERKKALTLIASGEAQVIVGTHALFQKEVVFSRLAVMVVDEQHRFGVEQRAALREKGLQNNCYPHQLIMTATPIPRTLAMSAYADLDYSVIDELPPGRTPIQTSVIANTKRPEVLERIRTACHNGRQAYWVCTLIEESEAMQAQAAENTAALLSSALSHIKIGLVHGRLKSAEKEKIMAAFKQGEIQLLVATTVIEVGVDVPNASLMIIENAERLGLAQLHQLRGRVGRGVAQSHCVLLYQSPLSSLAKERLGVMRETNDGFKIAERDLALRGPGEVLGTRQTGEVGLRIADLMRDHDLLPALQRASALMMEKYGEHIPALISRWLGDREKFANV